MIALFCIAALAFMTVVHGDASVYGVDLVFKDPSNVKEGHGGIAVSFTYNVTHTGTFLSENVTVELLDEPVGWSHFMAASTMAGVRSSTNTLPLTLQRNEVAPLVVQVTPPVGVANGIYGMVVLVYTDKDPAINASHDTYVIIGKLVGFELERSTQPPFDRTAVVPPETVTLCYELFNTGSVEDRYHIGYESSLAIIGWNLTLVNGTDSNGWTPSLPSDPGKAHPHLIQLDLAVPADAKAGTKCQVVVNATSAFNSSLRSSPLFTTIEALQYYDFMVLFEGENPKKCEVGQQVEFQFKIRNLGNGWDMFTVVPVWDPELNPGFISSVNPRTMNIPSNGTDLVSYTVRVPESAPKKVYSFKATISSYSRDLDSKSLAFTVEVPQFFKVELSSPQPRMTTFPGGILDYEVDVRNAGNGLDSMTIVILGVPRGWLTYVQPPEVSLLQNERSKVSIRVIVPSRFEEAPQGLYDLIVKADSSRSYAEALFTIQLDITPFYRIEWMYQDQPITDPLAPIAQPGIIQPERSFNPYERNYIDITLEIKNFGNADDDIQVWGVGLDPRVIVTVTPDRTLLMWDQTKLIKVHIGVPRELPPGEYSVFVNATSLDRMTPTRVVPLEFEVFNLDTTIPSVPTCIDVDRQGAITNVTYTHDECVFWLDVTNTGTAPLSSVQVRAYDSYIQGGRTVRWNFFSNNITGIQVDRTYYFAHFSGSTSDPAIVWWANVTGRHTIEFRVFYDHQSNVTNDVAYLDLTVVEAPPPPSPALMPLFFASSIVFFIAAVIIAVVLFAKRRNAREPAPRPDIRVDPAAFEKALPRFNPEPDRVAMMPRPTLEHVALYGQDLDGEDIDQVVEKAVDLDDDEVGP